VRIVLQLKLNASRRMVNMDTFNRHIHIVVVFLTVAKTTAKQFVSIAADTLHCSSSQPTLPQIKLSLLGSLCNLLFVVFTYFFYK
jgi:hypothetical protein